MDKYTKNKMESRAVMPDGSVVTGRTGRRINEERLRRQDRGESYKKKYGEEAWKREKKRWW